MQQLKLYPGYNYLTKYVFCNSLLTAERKEKALVLEALLICHTLASSSPKTRIKTQLILPFPYPNQADKNHRSFPLSCYR